MVDDSRSAKVFSSLITNIEDRNPEEAMGWITKQYEKLVGNCGAPASTTPTPNATAPATATATE